MVTAQDIQAGILVITRGADLLKQATELLDKTQNLEIKEIIVDLRSNLVETKNLLVDTKTEIVTLKEENDKLKEENKKLEDKLKGENKPIEKNGFFYAENAPNQPCCPSCWHSEGKLISLVKPPQQLQDASGYETQCPKCTKYFTLGLTQKTFV